MPVKRICVTLSLQTNVIVIISTICPGYWHYPWHLSDWHLWMWSSSILSASPLSGKSYNPFLFGRTSLELVFSLPDVAPGIFGSHRAVCARVKEVNPKVKTCCRLLREKNHDSRTLSEDLDYCDERGNSSSSFFFFHWHYSPLWALACRTRSFHFFPYLSPVLSIIIKSIQLFPLFHFRNNKFLTVWGC
jgi:hypothetical protein